MPSGLQQVQTQVSITSSLAFFKMADALHLLKQGYFACTDFRSGLCLTTFPEPQGEVVRESLVNSIILALRENAETLPHTSADMGLSGSDEASSKVRFCEALLN